MITIFTIPKPFQGHINIIQRNAIQSWLQLQPRCEVILFGNDKGVAETAKEFGVKYIPEIKKNEFNTPLLDSAFNLAQKLARNDILVYINADIILMSDFIPAIQQVRFPLFLINGRRWDLDIKEEINFNDPDWEKKLREEIFKKGKLHGFSGIDYFVFPRNLFHDFPPFAVGRPGWDNWLLFYLKKRKIPIIDATPAITVIHQSHPSKYRARDKESQENIKLAGGLTNMITLRESDWILTKEGLKKLPLLRRIWSKLVEFYPVRLFLALKRSLFY